MVIRVGGGQTGHFPRFLCENKPEFPWKPFEQWWNGAVYSTGTENIITRKELVLAVRSKDGGSHFDSELTCANYVNMKGGAGWRLMEDDVEMPLDPTHLFSIWTIGWELTTSINEHQRRLQSQLKGGE